MPIHPIDASYNHIIKNSIEIINWYLQDEITASSKDKISLETWHLAKLSYLLNEYLLYKNDLSTTYWREIRKSYLKKADFIQILHHRSGWEFLAHASLENKIRENIFTEFDKIETKYPDVIEKYFNSSLYKQSI
ncbi:hypothetical protein [Chondrinema litorale]|uniref:hypothetical protein n=1 Tax=Chondrinema litorale TaxID=2994555 RepID=UPI0025426B8C|nr:hypothetical protein [Chondrinema litorale]UZR92713.1 hypothetical protein OQ292_12680 [Chondrinema litorale]